MLITQPSSTRDPRERETLARGAIVFVEAVQRGANGQRGLPAGHCERQHVSELQEKDQGTPLVSGVARKFDLSSFGP